MDKKYYLGLDIGTESCGWAVTDENYNLLKAKGKQMWGVRLFDSAKTAEERRLKRTNRRRLARRKLKLSWLRDVFKEELDKVDPNFLDRLKYSNLWEDDKVKQNICLKSKDSLFNGKIEDKEYTDRDYFKEYETIYHLRNELTKTPAKDIRLLYLASHNIIKRRGHFLYDGDFSDNGNILNSIEDLISTLNEHFEDLSFTSLTTSNTSEDEILDLIKRNLGLRDTKNELYAKLNASNTKEKLLISCLVDGKFDIKKIFEVEDVDKLNFADSDYDTKIEEISPLLTDEQLQIIEKANSTYSLLQLKKMLGDKNYICEAMVASYEKHRKQLSVFKQFIKDYHPTQYFKIFRDSQENIEASKCVTNYPLYVKGSIYDGKKRVVDLNFKDRTKESFYKFVKSILNSTPTCELTDEIYNSRKNEILNWIDNEDFLLKQRSKANSVFSNKLYEKELKAILTQSAKKYSFLNDVDSNYGITNMEKILQILTFRVPYFVGPIGTNSEGQNHTWAEKECDITYRPWTLSKIINFDKAEDTFINKMSNKCTYLKDKDVLPKNSIIYSKFKVLNELNNLKINGNNITVNLKQKIFTELFEKENKVTVKKLKDFLVRENEISKEDIKTTIIGGIDNDFANNYSVYSKLVTSPNFGKEFVDCNLDMFEEIIKYHTVISDKSRLEKRIKNNFGHILNENQIKEIKGLNYQGWARFSKEFLTLPFVDKHNENGECTNIMEVLWNTNLNLQEIIFSNKYGLQETLDYLQEKRTEDLMYQDVENMYCSPAVKRGVWQSLKIIKEIRDTLGTMPEKIFVEVTRSDEEKGDKGRKLSRKTQLQNIYQSKEFKDAVKETSQEVNDLLKELNEKVKDDNTLRSEKYYLYFLQMGKCMYSGERINIEDITNDKMYDVDHIVPQSIVKDDSIDNKVLVKSEYNRRKDNNYPISATFPEWVNKQKSFWTALKNAKLISQKKYDKLTRIGHLSEEELGGFIARQLVETNQTVKAVMDLLKQVVDNPQKIVYSKARFVSDFRNIHGIYKSRTVNDLHHAKDAYLNIVVGNILNNRFTSDPKNFYKKQNSNSGKTKNIHKLFEADSIVCCPQTGEVVWNTNKDLPKIIKICESNSPIVTKMSYAMLNGQYYDESVYKSKQNDAKTSASVQLKGDETNPISNIERYGGYNSLKIAYFMVVESKKGTKTLKTIESVPILIYQKYKNHPNRDEKILEYIANKNGLIDVKVLLPRLNIQSTIKIDNGLYQISGKFNDYYLLYNANQWFATSAQTKYVKALEKYAELKKERKDGKLFEIDGKVILSPASKKNNIEIALTKQENEQLYEDVINQLSKNIYKGLQLEKGIKDKLNIHRNDFNNLCVLEQAKVLLGILQGISTGAAPADLTGIKESKFAGKLYISKNITDKNISLIEQSPTGLYTKVIKL